MSLRATIVFAARASVLLLAGWMLACHGSPPTEVPHDRSPEPAAPENARILLRGVGDGWEVAAAVAIQGGNSRRIFARAAPFFKGEAASDGLAVECPLHALCRLGFRHESGARSILEVVAADPRVEVEPAGLDATARIATLAHARYVEAGSRSAQVAALLEQELALVQACKAIPVGECGGVHVLPDPRRSVPGHDPAAAIDRLRGVLRPENHGLATWAYFNAGCPHSPMDAELASEALVEPIDPLARQMWPVGVARAIVAAEGPAGAEARVARMHASTDRDLAAALLIEAIHDARRQHDLGRASELHTRLRSGKGVWNGSPIGASLLAVQSIVGAPVGSLPLRTLAGEPRDLSELRGSPILLYTAASWCKPCHRDALPELRQVAAKHPDLTVIYVLFDEPDVAAAYAEQHAPIPGTVALADPAARAKIEVLLGAPAFPSFALIDREGRVAALPGADDLDTILERSGVLAR